MYTIFQVSERFNELNIGIEGLMMHLAISSSGLVLEGMIKGGSLITLVFIGCLCVLGWLKDRWYHFAGCFSLLFLEHA